VPVRLDGSFTLRTETTFFKTIRRTDGPVPGTAASRGRTA